MKFRLATFLPLALAVSCAAGSPEHQDLIALIESKVDLPKGANPLNDYSRHYASMPDNKVRAIYMIPSNRISDDVGCSVMLEDLTFRPCSSEENAEMHERESQGAKAIGKAGETRWRDDYRDLPLILDGGCTFIEISFNLDTQQVDRVECNGIS